LALIRGTFVHQTMTVKQQIRGMLDQLPDDCPVEDVQYRLYVVEILQKRSEIADRAEFISEKEIEARLAKWLVK